MYIVHFCNLNISCLSSKNALQLATLQCSSMIFVFATRTLVFLQKTKNRSVVSVSRIQSKISKVSLHPKNNPIFTHKVVTHPIITPKNIPKVGTTHQTSNTIQSQICPSHKDTYCPQHTNKSIILSVLHAHTINISTPQNIANTTTLHIIHIPASNHSHNHT